MSFNKIKWLQQKYTRITLAGLSASSYLIADEPFMVVSEEEYLQQLAHKECKAQKNEIQNEVNF